MIVVVLGLRRSGTSLVAGLLHRSGVCMGERFGQLGPEWNRDGGFEDEDFSVLLNHFAQVFHVSCGYLQNADPAKIQELRGFIAARTAKYPRWGLKSFSLLYLLPEFASHCPEPPRLLVMRRPFAASVNSYCARSGIPMGNIIQLFAHDLYNLDMVYKTYPGPKREIQFDALVEDPAPEVEKIASFCDIPAGNMAALIDPSQRRF